MEDAPAAAAPAPAPALAAFPWPQYYVLSFDPGTRDLGVLLMAYGAEGSDPMNDEEYYIRYGAVWDLLGDRRGTLQDVLEALHGVLHSEPALTAVLQDPSRVDVVIENQEGCDFANATLTASLMRMCGVASGLWMYFAMRGHHVEIVGKKSKWGWASLKGAPRYALLNEAQRRELRKKYITYFVMDLMRRQYDRLLSLIPPAVRARGKGDPLYDRLINMCAVNKQMMQNFARLPMDHKAHICDCATQAMFYARKRFRKTSKNVFPPDTWARMTEAVTSGGHRGITAAVLDVRNHTPGGLKRPRPTGLGLLPAAPPGPKTKRARVVVPAAGSKPQGKGTSKNKAKGYATGGMGTRTVQLSPYQRVPVTQLPLGMTVPL